MKTLEVTTKTKWNIDHAHSSVGFRVKHLLTANVRGSFKEFDASIYTMGNDFMTAEIDFWLNPDSLDTGNEKRDKHLKGVDFFDVDHFKEINFEGNTYENDLKEESYEWYGNLTMKGVSKQIKLEVEFGGVAKDPWGVEKAIFNIKGKINRKDWGLNWNSPLETGGLLVSDEVWINCEMQLVKETKLDV